MEDKELRRLNRRDLLEIVVQQRKRIEELEAKMAEADAQLAARCVRLDVQNGESWSTTFRILADMFEENKK